jgi:hypothetical protein
MRSRRAGGRQVPASCSSAPSICLGCCAYQRPGTKRLHGKAYLLDLKSVNLKDQESGFRQSFQRLDMCKVAFCSF